MKVLEQDFYTNLIFSIENFDFSSCKDELKDFGEFGKFGDLGDFGVAGGFKGVFSGFVRSMLSSVDFDYFKTRQRFFTYEEFGGEVSDILEKDYPSLEDLRVLFLFCISFSGENDFFVSGQSGYWTDLDYFGYKSFFLEEQIARLDRVKLNIVSYSFYNLSKTEFVTSTKILSDGLGDLENKISIVDTLIKKYDEKLEDIKKHTDELTLVAFAKGFNDDLKGKVREKRINTFLVIFFGILALTVPIFSIGLVMSGKATYSAIYSGDFSSILLFFSFLSIEILILYFFRICLLNGNNLKSQVLQLRLRVSVSKFISDYLNNEKLEGKNAETLARFESLVFKDISPDGSALVSVFDGLEQVSKIISTVKSK